MHCPIARDCSLTFDRIIIASAAMVNKYLIFDIFIAKVFASVSSAKNEGDIPNHPNIPSERKKPPRHFEVEAIMNDDDCMLQSQQFRWKSWRRGYVQRQMKFHESPVTMLASVVDSVSSK